MGNNSHEVRDVIHSFVYYDDRERAIIDSRPFQRLRDINQLGFAHFVYPGARHTRFEHSLGVMHLAERIYNTVTKQNNVSPEAGRKFAKELGDQDTIGYWRKVVKLAALCHDIGHLPYSHTAEEVIFPQGVDHETLSNELIKQSEIASQLDVVPPVKPSDVVKLALGPKKAKESFSEWEILLSEIIVGDAFGADRIDYLLRDSYHLGVPYGHFDHVRLIDSLRILKLPAADKDSNSSTSESFQIGIDNGGLRTVEGLLLARFHMYSQVYFHPKVKAYEQLLISFMKDVLEKVDMSDPATFLNYSDSEIYSMMCTASRDSSKAGHEFASRILSRRHFRVLYSRNKFDDVKNEKSFELVKDALLKEFSDKSIVPIDKPPKKKDLEFLVDTHDKGVCYASDVSDILTNIPSSGLQCIYVEPEILGKAKDWLENNIEKILRSSLDEALKGKTPKPKGRKGVKK